MLPIINTKIWKDGKPTQLLMYIFFSVFAITSSYTLFNSSFFYDENDNKNDNENINNCNKYTTIEYIDKYDISNLVEEDDLDIKKLDNCVILEYTPVGMIYMIYKNNEFGYYSNTTVNYNILDTVCRKFVKTFHCVSLYNKLEEIKKNEEPNQNNSTKNNKNKKSKLFANFKKNETHKTVKKHMNVFRKLGSLLEFKFLNTHSNKNTNIKPITFSDFKKMN